MSIGYGLCYQRPWFLLFQQIIHGFPCLGSSVSTAHSIKNRGIISDFSDVNAFPLFTIATNDSFCEFFLKMEQSRSDWIDTSKNENKTK